MSSSVTTLVFDLGNVLVRWNPRTYYRKVFEDEAEMEWFLSHVCNHAWNLSLDNGRSYADAVPQLKEQFPKWATYIDHYEAGWEHMFHGVIEENVALLKAAKSQGIPVFAITNWSHEKFPRALELFPFFKLFEGVVISGVEKLIKPDPRIFQLFLSRYQKRAQECFFIDDLQENVAAAESLGFYGHVFRDPLELKQDILRHFPMLK